jgi:ferritin-like metal-binding protein YciE
MSLNNLDELLLHDLRDTYDAERRITKALPQNGAGGFIEETKEGV